MSLESLSGTMIHAIYQVTNRLPNTWRIHYIGRQKGSIPLTAEVMNAHRLAHGPKAEAGWMQENINSARARHPETTTTATH